MDPTQWLGLIPAQYTLYVALFVIACKVVTVFVRPPAPDSKWAPVFQVVSLIALNVGWATNRLQVGKTGVMVPREQASIAKSAIASAGVPLLSGKVPPSHG